MLTQVTTEAAALDAEKDALARKNGTVLKKLEIAIQRGEDAFFAAARAVVEIIDKELFMPWFSDKTNYFKDRWDMSAQNLTRFENAGRVLITIEDAFTANQLPKNEGQCRALYRHAVDSDGLNEPKLITLWEAILNSGEKPTAKLINEKAENLFREQGSSAEPSSIQLLVADSQTESTDSVQHDDTVIEHTCSAMIVVILDDSTLKDAMEYEGRQCEQVSENHWKFDVTAKDKSSLIHELASWCSVYSVSEITIKFN